MTASYHSEHGAATSPAVQEAGQLLRLGPACGSGKGKGRGGVLLPEKVHHV